MYISWWIIVPVVIWIAALCNQNSKVIAAYNAARKQRNDEVWDAKSAIDIINIYSSDMRPERVEYLEKVAETLRKKELHYEASYVEEAAQTMHKVFEHLEDLKRTEMFKNYDL